MGLYTDNLNLSAYIKFHSEGVHIFDTQQHAQDHEWATEGKF